MREYLTPSELKSRTFIAGHFKEYYDNNDHAHKMDHVDDVLMRALSMADILKLDDLHKRVLVYCVYGHDIASGIDRENHHSLGAKMISEDPVLTLKLGTVCVPEIKMDKSLRCNDLMNNGGINTYTTTTVQMLMACAAFEHRASGVGTFSSILSEIVAAADRDKADPEYQMKRCLSYAKTHDKLNITDGVESSISYLTEVNSRGYQADGSYPEVYKLFYKDDLEALYSFYEDEDAVRELANRLSKEVW